MVDEIKDNKTTNTHNNDLLKKYKCTLKNRWWYYLASTALLTIVGTIAINFLYSNKQKQFTSTFSVNFSGKENNTYADGTPFVFSKIISKENLEKVKANNDLFKNIDVDKCLNDGLININSITSIDESTPTYYQVVFNYKAVKSIEVAKEFALGIVKNVIDTANSKIDNIFFDSYLLSAKNSKTYDTHIDNLNSQIYMLKDKYKELEESYSGFNFDGKTFNEYVSEINTFLGKNELPILRIEAQANGYSKNYNEEINNLKLTIQEYDRLLAINNSKRELVLKDIKDIQAIWENSQNQVLSLEAFTKQLVELSNEKANLDEQKRIAQVKIDKGLTADATEYNKKLAKVTDDITLLTDKYTKLYHDISKRKTDYTFLNSVVVESGGINLALQILISAFIGFVLSSAVICFVDFPKIKIEEKN